MTKIQIHKNMFKSYHDMKWLDVPEFLLFETVPEGWISVWDVEKPRSPKKEMGRAKMEGR